MLLRLVEASGEAVTVRSEEYQIPATEGFGKPLTMRIEKF